MLFTADAYAGDGRRFTVLADEMISVFLELERVTGVACSHEHENIVAPPLGTYIAQAKWKTSADGIEFMDTTLKTLKASLEAIRDTAMNALNQIDQSQEQPSIGWK